MKKQILVIDDEPRFRELLSRVIELEGFSVLQAENVREGFKSLEKEEISVVVTDVKLPDGNGLQVLERIRKKYPFIEVIVITAFGTIKDGVEAMKRGAFDYITKGDNDEHIPVIVERAVEKAEMQFKLSRLERHMEETYGFEAIVGESGEIQQAIELARKVAPSDMSVVLQGETGTGKELFARAIHHSGSRKNQSFVALNCSAFPKDLLESELFGFKKGAFTGAAETKKGFLEEADKGTLFLDEIAEMDPGLQAKMLRFLENNTFTKIGETKERSVDIRIIAATNRDLKKEAALGLFRDDLYYRLAGFTIEIPPLRQRRGDIPLLAQFFLKRLNTKVQTIDTEAMELLNTYDWRGNIRELKNVIERAAILSEGTSITADILPADLKSGPDMESTAASDSLKEVEKLHIRRVLDSQEGNKTKAAEILGIGTSTLYRKIEEYNL